MERSVWRNFGAGLFLLAAFGTSQAFAQDVTGDPVAGAEVFKKCAACHQVGPTAKNAVGPVQNGLIGRMAGTYPGYNYSMANKNSGLTWDVPTLTKYLMNPKALIPGTKMAFVGLSDPKDIANVIAYLAQYDAMGNKKQ